MRRLVWVDPFALGQIGNEYRLKGIERHVLLTLTMQASWRTQEWTGTITELATETGFGRRVVSDAIARLDDLRLVEVLRPFHQRGEGLLAVLAYCRLVNPEHCDDQPHRKADNASQKSGNRAAIAPISATDQGERGVPMAIRKKEDTGASESLEWIGSLEKVAQLQEAIENEEAAFTWTEEDGRPFDDDDLPAFDLARFDGRRCDRCSKPLAPALDCRDVSAWAECCTCEPDQAATEAALALLAKHGLTGSPC